MTNTVRPAGLSALVAALVSTTGTAGALLIANELCRMCSQELRRRVYAPRIERRLQAGKTSIVPLPTPVPFSWLEAIIRRVHVRDLLPEIGLDAVVYVGFTRCCLLIILLTCVFDLSVVLWANVQGDGHLNQQTYADLDVLSMANVPARSPHLWAHLVSVLLKSAVALKIVDSFSASIFRLQMESIKERAGLPEANTALVTDIPAGDSLVAMKFRGLWGRELLAYTPVIDPTLVDPISARRNQLRILLDDSVWRLNHPPKGKEEQGFRPTHKRGPLGPLGVPGLCRTEVVDSVDAYRAELADTERRIADVRHEVLTDRELVPLPPELTTPAGLQTQLQQQLVGVAETLGVAEPLKGRLLPLLGKKVRDAPLRPAAFVTFRRPRTAALAAQTLHTGDPYTWRVSAACAPSDIHWPNVGRLSHFQKRVARIAVAAAVFATCVFYMVPVAFVQGLTTIANLSRFLPFIVPALKIHVVSAIIEGVLPGLILILFYAILPPFFRFLSAKEGIDRESKLDVAQMRKLFLFGVLNVFLGNVIAGSIFKALRQMIDEPAGTLRTIATAIPGTSRFFLGFVLLKSVGGAAESISGIWSSIVYVVRKKLLGHTPLGEAACWAPKRVATAKNVSDTLVVFQLVLIFTTLQPVMHIIGLIYFTFRFLVCKTQVVYLHEPTYEGYGVMWPGLRNRLVVCLLLYQLTMCICLSLKLAAAQAIIIAVLAIPPTLFFNHVMNSRYNTVIGGRLPLELFAPEEETEGQAAEGAAAVRTEAGAASRGVVPFLHPALRPEREEDILVVPGREGIVTMDGIAPFVDAPLDGARAGRLPCGTGAGAARGGDDGGPPAGAAGSLGSSGDEFTSDEGGGYASASSSLRGGGSGSDTSAGVGRRRRPTAAASRTAAGAEDEESPTRAAALMKTDIEA